MEKIMSLKNFCEFMNIEYKSILGYSKNCWLSLYPAQISFNRYDRWFEILFPINWQMYYNNKILFLKSTIVINCNIFKNSMWTIFHIYKKYRGQKYFNNRTEIIC